MGRFQAGLEVHIRSQIHLRVSKSERINPTERKIVFPKCGLVVSDSKSHEDMTANSHSGQEKRNADIKSSCHTSCTYMYMYLHFIKEACLK